MYLHTDTDACMYIYAYKNNACTCLICARIVCVYSFILIDKAPQGLSADPVPRAGPALVNMEAAV